MSFKPANLPKNFESEMEAESKLMCQAHNCPNRWSVDIGHGKLCSAHAWADPMDWGVITGEINSRNITSLQRHEEPVSNPISLEEKIETLKLLKTLFKTPQDPKAWAHRLRERERNGENLSRVQRDAWREALRVRDDV